MSVRLNPDADLVAAIREGLRKKGGYCPCRLERTEAYKCMCGFAVQKRILMQRLLYQTMDQVFRRKHCRNYLMYFTAVTLPVAIHNLAADWGWRLQRKS